MNGLYFYKLESPYPEDVTKNCKLTVNEIDSNFLTLKDMDIKSARASEGDNTLILEKNNGDEIKVDLNPIIGNVTKDLNVSYDSENGIITIVYNDSCISIEGLVTKDNINDTILTKVQTDSTLEGDGTVKEPLSISPVEQTSAYKAVEKLYDLTTSNQPCLPNPCNLKKGDRFLTYENVSDYGFLYNYRGVKRIQEDLKNGWRVPTKKDWDGMLNAIEPCDEYKNHDSIMANQLSGRFAGKYLKSVDKWTKNTISCDCTCDDSNLNYDDILQDGSEMDSCITPKPKPICADGIDAYGMGLVPSGYYDGCQTMEYFGKRGYYWTSTISHVSDVYVKRFDYNQSGVIQLIENPQYYYSLRLVKDYDGSNHQEVENINGINYPTVLLPSETAPSGFAIWTAVNVSFNNERYNPCKPNNGLDITSHKSYFINEWNGFDFVRKEMQEGDTVVILNNDCERYSVKYRIVNGVLVDESKMIYNDVIITITPKLEKLINKVHAIDLRVDTIENTIDTQKTVIANLKEGLEQEKADRQTADAKLTETINGEAANRESEDKRIEGLINDGLEAHEGVHQQIWDALDKETSERKTADEEIKELIKNNSDSTHDEIVKLQEQLDNEKMARGQADEALQQNIDAEAAAREEGDKQLQANIDEEATVRQEGDNTLNQKIDDEVAKLEEADAALQTAIENEATQRSDADTTLQTNIDAEAENRFKGDNLLQSRIDTESTLREEGDNQLSSDIANEATQRNDADKVLQTNIDSETSARTQEDKRLQNLIDNEAAVREEGDNTLQTNIDAEAVTRQEADESLNNLINKEVSERQNEISRVESLITDEENSRIAKDNELANSISDEATAREEGDNALDAKITAEEETRKASDEEILDIISSYEGDLTGITNELKQLIKDEENARIANDTALQSNIDNEATAREEGDNNSIKAIEEETTRAQEAENALSQKMVIGEGSYYDCGQGILYLKQEGNDMGITIKLTSNYGTF